LVVAFRDLARCKTKGNDDPVAWEFTNAGKRKTNEWYKQSMSAKEFNELLKSGVIKRKDNDDCD